METKNVFVELNFEDNFRNLINEGGWNKCGRVEKIKERGAHLFGLLEQLGIFLPRFLKSRLL